MKPTRDLGKINQKCGFLAIFDLKWSFLLEFCPWNTSLEPKYFLCWFMCVCRPLVIQIEFLQGLLARLGKIKIQFSINLGPFWPFQAKTTLCTFFFLRKEITQQLEKKFHQHSRIPDIISFHLIGHIVHIHEKRKISLFQLLLKNWLFFSNFNFESERIFQQIKGHMNLFAVQEKG